MYTRVYPFMIKICLSRYVVVPIDTPYTQPAIDTPIVQTTTDGDLLGFPREIEEVGPRRVTVCGSQCLV